MIWLVFGMIFAAASAEEGRPAWIEEGPYLTEQEVALELPLEVFADKLYLTVEVAGAPRRFVFDTGSPSMISAALAESLERPVVDRRRGVDAHGAVIESDIVQVDLSLSGIVFHRVPAFVADLSTSSAAQCFVGDGVLGSEVLPLCAWQVDRRAGVLRCHTNRDSLPGLDGAHALRLYDFGYPHTPILDVQYTEDARSKVMFDTGATGVFTLSQADYEGIRKQRGIDRIGRGYGSAGGSLGGPAPNRPQVRVLLESLALQTVSLGAVVAPVRQQSPSLFGASLLRHFVVTLDARSETAYLKQTGEPPSPATGFGFRFGFENEITVALVWDESPAAEAGLEIGQVITAINGKAVDGSCDGMRRALDAMAADSIELAWRGGSATLERKAWPP